MTIAMKNIHNRVNLCGFESFNWYVCCWCTCTNWRKIVFVREIYYSAYASVLSGLLINDYGKMLIELKSIAMFKLEI